MRALAFALSASAALAAAELPHVVFLLIDDWGWADASWHASDAAFRGEVVSPHMQALVEEGIELDHNYAYKFCSPTRSAIQSGRNPIHVNAQNIGMAAWDPENPLVGVAGIPVNMTGMASRLAEAGYKRRVFAGKADFGMAYWEQTPMGRGYTHALYYHQHMNDYWSLNVGQCAGGLWTRDLFGTDGYPAGDAGPQFDKLNPPACWVQNMSAAEAPVQPFPTAGPPAVLPNGSAPHPEPPQRVGCAYEEDYFTNFTVGQILAHDAAADGPLFAFHAAHSIHSPLEAPREAYAAFAHVSDRNRRAYRAMVSNVDAAVGRIVGALRQKGMYDNSLIIISSDNGGPVYMQGRGGGSNYPLRGGKAGNWQGGIRVNGAVAGGFVPAAMRGKKLSGLVTAWDWYSTLVHGIAGLDAADTQAAAAGLPPIDSVDQWPYLSGATAVPPRTELPVGSTADARDIWASGNDIVVQAYIEDDVGAGKLWKLVLGASPQNVWTGPLSPNATDERLPPAESVFHDCGSAPGCLFELRSDEAEQHDIAAAHPDVVKRLRAKLSAANGTVFAPRRPNANAQACQASLERYHDPVHEFGWWGPFAQ